MSVTSWARCMHAYYFPKVFGFLPHYLDSFWSATLRTGRRRTAKRVSRWWKKTAKKRATTWTSESGCALSARLCDARRTTDHNFRTTIEEILEKCKDAGDGGGGDGGGGGGGGGGPSGGGPKGEGTPSRDVFVKVQKRVCFQGSCLYPLCGSWDENRKYQEK